MTPLSDSEAATVQRFENAEPAPESWGGGLREALAEAIWVNMPDEPYRQDADIAADALLPVVTAYAEQRARERAAEELRAAADYWDGPGRYRGTVVDRIDVATGDLRDRADALAADDRTGQR